MIDAGADIPAKMAYILHEYRAEGRSWNWLEKKFDIPASTLYNIAEQKYTPELYTAIVFWKALGLKLTLAPLDK